MGRPREHDERTREDLRAAAELLVAEGGPDALSVRAVAGEAGTTTRAVYSIFGSKDGLVAALAQTAFELLYDNIDRLPETDDPVADLVAVGTKVVRGLVRQHPALYRIAFQRIAGLQPEPGLVAARRTSVGPASGPGPARQGRGTPRPKGGAGRGTRAERDVGRPRQCRAPRRRAAHHAEERGGTGLERGPHHRPPRLPRLNSPAEANKSLAPAQVKPPAPAITGGWDHGVARRAESATPVAGDLGRLSSFGRSCTSLLELDRGTERGGRLRLRHKLLSYGGLAHRREARALDDSEIDVPGHLYPSNRGGRRRRGYARQ